MAFPFKLSPTCIPRFLCLVLARELSEGTAMTCVNKEEFPPSSALTRYGRSVLNVVTVGTLHLALD